MAGKDEDWIKVYVHGEYGFVNEGKSVFPMFRDHIHVSKEIIKPNEMIPLLIGADFGLTPAGIIAQKLPDGRWLIIDELVTDNCGITRFAELLTSYISKNYHGFKVDACFADPAGNQRSFSDEKTALQIMNERTQWKWKPAPVPNNDPVIRREVVISTLNRLVDGNPGILISPKAATLRKGFSGGYHYKFVKSGNGTQTHEVPAKNEYSHPHDALQYLLLGGGEHQVVMNKVNRMRSDPSRSRIARGTDYDIFGSKGGDYDIFGPRKNW